MNLQVEKKFTKKGYRVIVGIDEVGRGSLAGPVMAGAVQISERRPTRIGYAEGVAGGKAKSEKLQPKVKDLFKKLLAEVKDSKQLAPKRREEIYRQIVKCSYITFGVGRVGEKTIDKINILEATRLAMKRAINNLKSKIQTSYMGEPIGLQSNLNSNPKFKHQMSNSIIDLVLVDGNIQLDIDVAQKSIIKADEKIFSCAVASIVAKVRRDSIMKRKDEKYPQYGFAQNKGYGTEFHCKMLKKYGPCKIHRYSYSPVRLSIAK